MTSRIKDDVEHMCYLCGTQGRMEVHHVFEGCTRKVCDADRLIVHLCRICHDRVHGSKGNDLREFLHRTAQLVYEDEIGSREDFIKRYVKSYL